jgi:hypothetical protein
MTSEKQIAVQNVSPEKIQSRILVIRGAQVMLDRDLAELYGVSVKRLNEQVRRNIERFPSGFMFQLSASEFADLKSQIATSSWGGIRKAPKVFTEQGVAMLSAVLNSPTAILVSIAIMEAFVRMRHFMMDNAEVVCRMNVLEKKQMSTDAKVDDILKRLDSTERPSQGVFYDGQLWDARALVLKLIGSAKRSIILIDNWATTETLDLFTKKRRGVKLTIFTSEHYDKKHVPHHKISDADIATFNAQYPHLAVRYNETFHDRFLIVDDKDLYLIGASLKDLGKKCFGFTKMNAGAIRGIKKSAFGLGAE